MKKLLKILNTLDEEDRKYLSDILFKDNIEVIKEKANNLKKLAYGAGGQSIKIQKVNQKKHELGSKILKEIEEFEQWKSEL